MLLFTYGGRKLDKKIKVYQLLLDDIINLKYLPGEYIKEEELSSKFNMSRTPFREILKRLAYEGFIEVIPRHGNRIALIKAEAVKQMAEMRILLESEVVRELIIKILPEELEVLSKILSKQNEAIDKADNTMFWELDNLFHSKLFEIANKTIWWDIIKQYEANYMRFRRLEMTNNTNYDLLYIHHKNIMGVIKDRKFEAVLELLSAHVGQCVNILPILKDKYPLYFENESNIKQQKRGIKWN